MPSLNNFRGSITSGLASLVAGLVLASACGDDGTATTTEAATETTTTTETATTTATATGEPTTAGSTTAGPTTDDSSTGETSGSSGGELHPCGAPLDDGDLDRDGTPNRDDNCPCDENPNQLDFDNNGDGNVCDEALHYTVVDANDNVLVTEAKVKELIFTCKFPLDLKIIGASVRVRLDDEGAGSIWYEQLTFDETPAETCKLTVATMEVAIIDLYGLGSQPYGVGFSFTSEQDNAGLISATHDSAHDLELSAVLNILESSNENLAEPGEHQLDYLQSVFPPGAMTLDAAGELEIDFDDPDYAVYADETDSGLKVTLTGLTGTMRLSRAL